MEFQVFFIILLLIITGISYYLKKVVVPKIKGAYGEHQVSRKLRRLKKSKYIVLNDILLEYGNGTTQIDHIVISKSGIFVIETKNYKGWIHGHEKSEYWSQTLYKYKNKFRNPIKQNWVHVYALKSVLSKLYSHKFFPIIVFTGSGKLKNITSNLPVIYTKQLLKTIRKNSKELNLSESEMKAIADKILHFNITGRKRKQQHVKQVRKKARSTNRKEKLKICPKCNGKLEKRKGKYGKFYGCSNFPKCRYTLNVS